MRRYRRGAGAGRVSGCLLVLGWPALMTLPAAAAESGAPQPSAQQNALRLTSLEVLAPGAGLVATVPPGLVGRPLPSAAFSVQQAGRTLPVTADRVVDGAAELVLVIDTNGSAEDVATRQLAATDLLRALPPELRMVVLPGGQVGTVASSYAAVAGLQRGPGDPFAGLPEQPAGRRLVVLLTGCAALDRVPVGLQLPDGQISVLADDGFCDRPAERLAAPGAGLARTGLTTSGLFAAVDEVSRNLLGQYRLRVAGLDAAAPLEVTVVAGDTSASGTTAPAEPVAGGDGGDGDGYPYRTTDLAAAAVAGLGASAWLASWLVARRQDAKRA